MRVLVTGATGFVGRWLLAELRSGGHEPVGLEERPDIRDSAAVSNWLARSAADAVIHLAAVSFGPDAAADPATAVVVNIGGTLNVVEACGRLRLPPAILVVSSSEVYAAPPDDRPIDEEAALGPRSLYGLSKVGQESVALAGAERRGLRLAVARPFNHTGPGQRPSFVVPALARRIAAVRRGDASSVRVGNLDVRRDFGDVRDVVRAYRLLAEALVGGAAPTDRMFNIATGEAVAIRELIARISRIAGVVPAIEVDPALVRLDDPPVIRGDARRLRDALGWQPEIPLDQTLADVAAEALEATGAAVP